MTSTPHLRVFGAVELLNGAGRPVRFRTRKHLALAAVLVLDSRDRDMSRERLIELLWPDASGDKARHSLSQGFTVVRSVFGKAALVNGRRPIRFRGSVTTDLDLIFADEVLERLAQAPLPALDDLSGVEFSHWIEGKREQLRQMARVRLSKEIESLNHRGEIERAGVLSRALYRIDPMNDRAAMGYTEALLIGGERAEAIRVLDEHMRLMRDELEVEPSPVIVRLRGRLENPARKPAQASVEQLQALSRRRETKLVGRAGELAELERTWAAVREGATRVLTVSGPTGIGKSTLLRNFTGSIESRAWPVLTIQCQQMGGRVPYAAVSDLIMATTADPAVGGTDPQSLADASRVAPRLKLKYPGIPQPFDVPPESVKLRVADAVVKMLETVSDGSPLLIGIDDVQHIDPTSAEILHMLQHRMQGMPVMLCVTLMASYDGPSPLISDGMNSILNGSKRLHLDPVEPDELTELVKAVLAAEGTRAGDDVISAVVAGAHGIPYLAEVLLEDWKENGENALINSPHPDSRWKPPDIMRRAFDKQYAALSEEARELIGIVAVAGRSVTLETAFALAEVNGRTNQATMELTEKGILQLSGGALSFRNESHERYVYHTTSPDHRRLMHSRIANELLKQVNAQNFQLGLEAAHHLVQADMKDRALETVKSSAEIAISRGAPREAERALEEVIKGVGQEGEDLCLPLARSHCGQGQYLKGYETAIRFERKCLLTPATAAQVAVVKAECVHRGKLQDPNRSKALAEQAVSQAVAANALDLKLSALQICAEIAADQSDSASIQRIRNECLDVVTSAATPFTLALSHLTLGYCLLEDALYSDAIESLDECGTRFRQLRDELHLHKAFNGLGICHTAMGNHGTAIQAFKKCLILVESFGNKWAIAVTLNNLAEVYMDLGRFEEAQTLYSRAITTAEGGESPRWLADLYSNASLAALVNQDCNKAATLVEQATDAALKTGLVADKITALIAEGRFFLAQGDEQRTELIASDLLAISEAVVPHKHRGWYDALKVVALTRTASTHQQLNISHSHTTLARVPDQLRLALCQTSLCPCSDDEQQVIRKRMQDTGLFGIAATLAAIGIETCVLT